MHTDGFRRASPVGAGFVTADCNYNKRYKGGKSVDLSETLSNILEVQQVVIIVVRGLAWS